MRTTYQGRHTARVLAGVMTLVCLAGCSSLIDTDVAADTNDPRAYNTAEGALERYRSVIMRFRDATTASGSMVFVRASGLLSDELTTGRQTLGVTGNNSDEVLIDSRMLPEQNEEDHRIDPWTQLHSVRISAMDAIGALRAYAPNTSRDRIGHAFALWGFAEVMLADLYCSGIPLSTLAFEGDIVRAKGSTQEEVYEHARTLFDSALHYTTDSLDYRSLASIGKAWALLGLKQYQDAADAVADVPTSFRYRNPHTMASNGQGLNFMYYEASSPASVGGSVADKKGGNGLPYRSDEDPRIPFDTMPPDPSPWAGGFIGYAFRPLMTPSPGTGAVTMASGIEARLIEAEAALNRDDPSWLTILNKLRTTDGGIAGLSALTDPGTPTERVDTLFKERAFWLYLTGRRLGDMRRLVRQYGREVDEVFPTGFYAASPNGVFGTAVNLPVPYRERRANANYKGCINRDA